MIWLVYGGSGSGKSEYAENIAVELNSVKKKGQLFYIATMKIYDQEGEKKVLRHKALRRGKGFETIEQSENIHLAAEKIRKRSGECCKNSTVLLECLSNLVANEMFTPDGQKSADSVVAKIRRELELLFKQVKNVVVVSNNIFEDGNEYDESTREYMKALGNLNILLAKLANKVTEVVVGLPVAVKE